MRYTGLVASGLLGLGLVSFLAAGSAARDFDVPIDPPPERIEATGPTTASQRKYSALRLFTQAKMLEKQHRVAEAVALLEKALAQDPQAVPILKALVPACLKLDRITRAIEYGKTAVELDPTDADLGYQVGQLLREQGEKAEALRVLSRAANQAGAKDRPAMLAEMLFAVAMLQEELKLPAAAAESYAQVVRLLEHDDELKNDPGLVSPAELKQELARTYERLGHCRLRAGQFEQAKDAFRQCQAKSPQPTNRLPLHLAMVHQAAGQFTDAIKHLEEYLATQPPDVTAYETYIQLLTSLGRQREVLPALENAVQRDCFNVRLKVLLAQQYIAAQDANRGEAVYVALMNSQPSEEAYRGLAGLYAQQGRWGDLLRRFDEACGDTNRAPVAKLQLEVVAKERTLVLGLGQMACLVLEQRQVLSPQTRRLLCVLCRQAQRYDLAEFLCRTLLRDPGDRAAAYLELCRILAESEQFVAEAQACSEALTQGVGEAFFFQLERAKALALAGDAAGAQAQVEALAQAHPPGTAQHEQVRFMRATVLHRNGQAAAAIREAEGLLSVTPDESLRQQLRHWLGTLYLHAKNYVAAQKHLEALLESSPDDPAVLADLGYLWAEEGKNLEEAERLIRRAIHLDRAQRQLSRSPLAANHVLDSAPLLDSLAWVLHKRGRSAEALKLLDQAAALPDGNEPTLHEHRGDIQAALNDLAGAVAAWQKALAGYQMPLYRGLASRQQEVTAKLRQAEVVRAGAVVPRP